MKKIMIESSVNDKQECHSCGKVDNSYTFIWLEYLCQHYIALCPRCLILLKEKLLNKQP